MRRMLLVAVLAALLVAPVARAWTWPVGGPVLQPFSFDPAHPYAAGEHRGIDIAAGAEEVVLAPAAGTVTFSGTVPGSGRALTITTADGFAVTLTHLGSLSVVAGTSVDEGQTGRRRRPERRPRGRRAVPPPGHPRRRRGAGLSRPALVPAARGAVPLRPFRRRSRPLRRRPPPPRPRLRACPQLRRPPSPRRRCPDPSPAAAAPDQSPPSGAAVADPPSATTVSGLSVRSAPSRCARRPLLHTSRGRASATARCRAAAAPPRPAVHAVADGFPAT